MRQASNNCNRLEIGAIISRGLIFEFSWWSTMLKGNSNEIEFWRTFEASREVWNAEIVVFIGFLMPNLEGQNMNSASNSEISYPLICGKRFWHIACLKDNKNSHQHLPLIEWRSIHFEEILRQQQKQNEHLCLLFEIFY